MLKISREIELGLLLMAELARQPKQLTGLKDWAEERGLPYRFSSKVAVKLKKAKLLKSKEGREGGYRLAKAADKIKIKEIMVALEGPMTPVSCLAGRKCSLMEFCGHRSLLMKLVKVMEKQLNKVSLKDLC